MTDLSCLGTRLLVSDGMPYALTAYRSVVVLPAIIKRARSQTGFYRQGKTDPAVDLEDLAAGLEHSPQAINRAGTGAIRVRLHRLIHPDAELIQGGETSRCFRTHICEQWRDTIAAPEKPAHQTSGEVSQSATDLKDRMFTEC
ncbi:hypothetical protein BJF93_16255 [Xaviernesmea oryzae]|uniref:Uncharacterized protein n=1 Tax=Xaviernesmea oryzae TaxID=464029 RepID=A0A1Q9ASM7_9HYPH|nr:hypothetical protein BJF93_16255 [Xaviernesmea oryzae]